MVNMCLEELHQPARKHETMGQRVSESVCNHSHPIGKESLMVARGE